MRGHEPDRRHSCGSVVGYGVLWQRGISIPLRVLYGRGLCEHGREVCGCARVIDEMTDIRSEHGEHVLLCKRAIDGA